MVLRYPCGVEIHLFRELYLLERGWPDDHQFVSAFVEFPLFLDEYVRTLDQQNPRQLLNDYVHFQLFYFVHNADAARQQRLRAALLDLGVPEASLLEAEAVVGDAMLRIRPAGD